MPIEPVTIDEMRLVVLVALAACGGSQSKATSSSPASPVVQPTPDPVVDKPLNTTESWPFQDMESHPDKPDEVAVVEQPDPCDGGEATGPPGTRGEPPIVPTDVSEIGQAPGHGARRLPPRDYGVTVKYSTPKITGAIDAVVGKRVVERDGEAHKNCFSAVNATVGGIPDGTVTLDLEVDGTGTVTASTTAGIHDELAHCLERRGKQLHFPPPKDQKPARLGIKLTFTKTKQK